MNQKGFYLESIILLVFIGKIKADWGSADSSQYHIQTDEGPERFFRYQTDSGQFRNERRLKDGTVIGTEAWVDASGYLRQKDYIADKDGYRILKSKTVYIGVNRPIKDVISNGRINTKLLETTTPTTPTSRPILAIPSLSSVPHTNAIDDDYGYAKKKTAPSILVHFNAEPIDGSINDTPSISTTTTTIAPPVTTYKPFYSTTTYSTSTPSQIISSTSVLPQHNNQPTSISMPSKYFLPPPLNDVNDSPIIRIKPYNSVSAPGDAYTIEQINNELQPPISLNDIGSISTTPRIHDTKSIVPLFSRNSFYRGSSKRPIAYYQPNQLDSANDEKHFDRYSARVPNGFSYFLPRHYHEETYREANANNRDGSYGYIDPFGIRRVVYYQASPDGGFKIRKNNRYVGFHAKPYDSKK